MSEKKKQNKAKQGLRDVGGVSASFVYIFSFFS